MKRYIQASDRGDGLIGIWWYDEVTKEVIGPSEPVDDGVVDNDVIQYHSGNHLTLWKNYAPSSQCDKGYKSMYRGRVIYDIRTQCYEITCSEHLLYDADFHKAIIDYFQLSNCRRSFVALNPYRDKVELTGNSAVDALYYDF